VVLFIFSFGNVNIFIKASSYGIIFTLFMIFFIVYHGILAFSDSNFEFLSRVVIQMNDKKIDLFKTNFAPLAGMCTLGF